MTYDANELRALLDAAHESPLPWERSGWGIIVGGDGQWIAMEIGACAGALSVAAVNALPELLDTIDRVSEEALNEYAARAELERLLAFERACAEKAEVQVAAMKLRALAAHAAVWEAMQTPGKAQDAVRDEGAVHLAIHSILDVETESVSTPKEWADHVARQNARIDAIESDRAHAWGCVTTQTRQRYAAENERDASEAARASLAGELAALRLAASPFEMPEQVLTSAERIDARTVFGSHGDGREEYAISASQWRALRTALADTRAAAEAHDAEVRAKVEAEIAARRPTLEEAIDAWHASETPRPPLHEWLGLTREEWGAYVEQRRESDEKHDARVLADGYDDAVKDAAKVCGEFAKTAAAMSSSDPDGDDYHYAAKCAATTLAKSIRALASRERGQ